MHEVKQFNTEILVDSKQIGTFAIPVANCKQKLPFREVHIKKDHIFELVNNHEEVPIQIEHFAVHAITPVIPGFNSLSSKTYDIE